MSIFVSIAAYRDPQLVPTIEDCLAKARHPEALRFGVCWQHGPEEERLPFADDPRFRILDVDWRESRGACWARAEIMGLYDGEDYFLQLDSHHRFAPDWDLVALRQLERTGSPKPVLTAYATAFDPDDPASFGSEPMQMDFDRFTPEGIVLFRPSVIPGWRDRERPLRARFLSAHFLFAPGAFVREVPYDPELYFTGEEITLAVRAYTHGWDLFHPTEIVVWHEYTRAYRPHKHWSDHRHDNGITTAWHERDAASKERVRRFLAEPHGGPLGCGTARTFAEYEAYAGLSFRHRRVQEHTRQRLEPPGPAVPPDWAERIATYPMEIALDRAMLPTAARFWYVGFHDANEAEIHREDADRAEIETILAQPGPTVRIARTFDSEREPASWTVWPCGEDDAWHDKIRGEVRIRPRPAITLVTALLDLGRDTLDPVFRRAFDDHYRRHFEPLLALDVPMVLHVDPALIPFVSERRDPAMTRIVPLTKGDLERLPFYARVQELRARPEWRAQAAWLAESPQARLPGYAPLVLSKMRFLRDAAREDPFGTGRTFWVDAGLAHTVRPSLLQDRALPRALAQAPRELVFAAYPYRGAEVHGFPTAALEARAESAIEHVVRAGLFGGTNDALLGLAALYDAALAETLDAGLLGTEESVFTLLAHRYPELVQPHVIGDDGLLAPFVEALLAGRLEPQPLRSRTVASSTVASSTPDDETRAVAKLGETRFFGLVMQQNVHGAAALDRAFKRLEASGVEVRRIVELGTGAGGLSVLLQLYALSRGADFVTYDVHPRTPTNAAFERLSIDLRVEDVRDPRVAAEIGRMLEGEGVSVLVCDGGDKVGDATRFAEHLKPGDYVLLHDYAESRETFARDIDGKLWSWCEVTEDALRELDARGFEEVLADVLHPAVWTCRTKRGVAKARRLEAPASDAALYAITYNLPAQLALWLESVERAEPALLSRTDKWLLDNSTDASTREAYDALARRYGFEVIRRGNLGITGGRIFCAHHFADGPHERMLYFEDDMLLASDEGTCANGFRRYVPELFAKSREILEKHPELDFLKLSYTEFFGDHRVNWAHTNLDEERRRQFFPNGAATRVESIESHRELPYLIGEVHYSNWPMWITRRGSEALFARDAALPRHEQGLMVRALELGRAGRLRGGVLLASPIRHQRDHHYGPDRKEG